AGSEVTRGTGSATVPGLPVIECQSAPRGKQHEESPAMTSDEVCYLDLVDVGRRIQARQFTSLEVTQAILERIARLDLRFKSYATPTPDLALAQARRADSEIARGALRGPLHGVPIAVKDLCHTEGIATAAGMPMHKDHRPDRDATVVARLAEAGAVLV